MKKQKMLEQPILLFDLDSNGHHASYIETLIMHYIQFHPNQKIVIVLSPDYQLKHSVLIDKIETYSDNLFIQYIDNEVFEFKNTITSGIKRAFFEWNLFCKYATKYQAKHGLLMYLDLLQPAIILGQKSPCSFSGILFRPTLVNYSAQNWKEKLAFLRKKIVLKLLISVKNLSFIFSLDYYAGQYMTQKWGTTKAIYLADPVMIFDENVEATNQLKSELKIEENRKVFLLFGYLDDRKGISSFLNAIKNLDKKTLQNGCLLLVGKWDKNERILFEETIIKYSQLNVFQFIIVDYFVEEKSIQSYFKIADFVLALYQKHIGMSGILNRAAIAERPVISNNYGLMGKLVKEYELGFLINDFSEIELEKCIENCLNSNELSFNYNKIKTFAALSHSDLFAQNISNKIKLTSN